MPIDPATLDLAKLFRDPDMFDTADDWRSAGFEILRDSENKIVVASHSSVEGYLFKKYVNAGKREALDDQLENYESRLEGARRLRAFIADRRLRHVVVPRKWLRELPSRFAEHGRSAHILIVERLDLLDDRATARRYWNIDEDVLRDLSAVLHAFRGLDSSLKNVPFTTRGQVAFVDTEHWDRHAGRKKKRAFLKYIGDHLSGDSWRIAKKMWDRLEDEYE